MAEITNEDSRWESLYNAWVSDKRPGTVIARNGTYKVIKRGDTDDTVLFIGKPSVIDAGYESISKLGRLGG